jgi:hypothetical protein
MRLPSHEHGSTSPTLCTRPIAVTKPYRQRTIGAASGLVLEIGVGSGQNLPLYGSAVDRVYAIDPSMELLHMARNRIAEGPCWSRRLELGQSVLPRCRIVSPSSIREMSARYDEVAQREAEIQPNRVLDDLGREAMAAVGERSHLDILPGEPFSRPRSVTVPRPLRARRQESTIAASR